MSLTAAPPSAAPITEKEGSTIMSQGFAPRAFNVERLRADFPILQQTVHGKPLVYLDNAATTQKPRAVIEAISNYYLMDNANVHRGVHELSERATRWYESARTKVRQFLGASDDREIVFVRGCTEAINLVASSFGGANLRAGDEVLITAIEHHSNIVPWQVLCEHVGAKLRVAPINDRGEVVLEEYERLLSPRTRLVAVTHVSNALGTVNPVKQFIDLAHQRDVPVLVDGAQAVPHMRVNVRELDCDFYALSGHKLFGPTGIGVLFGKARLLEQMPPYQSGGDMIQTVTFEKTVYNVLPYKFEAGTPNIAGAVGLGAAVDYLTSIDMRAVAAHEQALLDYATRQLQTIPGLKVIGTAKHKASVISFQIDGVHPHDLGTLLDGQGVAIRTGHHCAQPVMDRFQVPATARASLAFYNNQADIDALVAGIRKVIEMLR